MIKSTDFQTWLEQELAAATTNAELPTGSVDLATVLAELAALRTEVRNEARGSRELREQVRDTLNQPAPAAAPASTDDGSRDRLVLALIDIADRLEAGLQKGHLPEPVRRRWRWPWSAAVDDDSTRRQLDALLQGLSLTTGRLALHLERAGVERIVTVGRPFDGLVMRAVESRPHASPSGTVIEEICAGYRIDHRVVRFADVVVAKESSK